MTRLSLLLSTTMLSVAALATPTLAQQAGQPVETRERNAPQLAPYTEDMTRAPQPAEVTQIATETVAEGLPQLWSLEFLPDGRMLVSAKEGAMHIVGTDGTVGEAIAGVPAVDAQGQGGLLDLALAPDFETSNLVFFSFAEPRDGGNGTSVGKGRLVLGDGNAATLEDVEIIFQQMPTYAGQLHYGSRLVFGNEGELYVTVGERSDVETRVQAQDVASGFGKVFRIDQNGEAWEGNPFADGADGALPEIWSYGHRNVQAAALDPEGRLWTVEHGPRGGDELNLPLAGLNYGWPVISYGIEYAGPEIGDGIVAEDGMEQPVYFWDPVIAPSGMTFYTGDAIPAWQGAALIGGLQAQGIVALKLEGDKVVTEEVASLGARVRDVKQGPDGAVYAVTEGGGGSTIVRVTAAQ